METKLERLTQEALTLNADERIAFAELLLASIEPDTEIEQAWAEEAARRDAELDRGDVEGISIEEAIARLRARVK